MMRGLVARGRGHPGYVAFVVHRLSGVVLALFLPVHFHVLVQAVRDAAAFDGLVRWTEAPAVRAAEMLLVVLLAAHLTGGLRLLSIEFLGWRDWQGALVALAFGLALATGLLYLLAGGT
jgi:fumarate reductase subunit D